MYLSKVSAVFRHKIMIMNFKSFKYSDMEKWTSYQPSIRQAP